MKHRILSTLAISSLALPLATAIAQSAPGGNIPPPKVMVIVREYLKPGKSGSLHAKTEGAFVKAMADAKWPTHYIAMDSISGPNRSLFLMGYDSFDAWGKDQEAQNANATLSAATDEATIADGELLEKSEQHAFVYHPEMSLRHDVDIPHARYWEFTSYVVKMGHEKEFEELAKLYMQGFASTPEMHWATYESVYGEDNGGRWVVINPMRSLGEVDKGMANGKAFEQSLGEAGMKHVQELAESSIQSVQTNVFVVNPKMSYAADEWATAAPEIWGQH